MKGSKLKLPSKRVDGRKIEATTTYSQDIMQKLPEELRGQPIPKEILQILSIKMFDVKVQFVQHCTLQLEHF